MMKALVSNINKVKKELEKFINNVFLKWEYLLPLSLTLIISYGFNLFNRTISIDDLGQENYYGSGLIKIRGLRWGQWLTNRIFSTIKYTPFLNRFLGVAFFTLTIIILCTILYHFDNKKDNIWKYTIFSCIFVSYPLINEFWEYYESLTIPFQYFIVSLSLLYELVNKRTDYKNIILVGLVMSIVMAGYESLIFTYITIVLVVLFIEYVLNNKKNGWLVDGLSYAYPLVVAVILRFVIGYGILFVSGLTYEMDGASSIVWLDEGAKAGLVGFLTNGWYYGVRSLSYLPLTELLIAIIFFIIFIISKQRKDNPSIILGLLIIISLFGLGLLQGTRMLYRSAQGTYFFVAFIAYLLCEIFKSKKFKQVIVVVLLFVSYRQAVYMHQILALDNQRSDNETAVINELGYELVSNYDLNKTVIFCGEYHLGENLETQISVNKDSFAYKVEETLRDYLGDEERPIYDEFVYSDVNSVINWGRKSFDGQTMLRNYFAYCGYDIKTLEDWDVKDGKSENELILKYTKIAEDNNMKPLSIKEFDDYILVYLGEIINPLDRVFNSTNK